MPLMLNDAQGRPVQALIFQDGSTAAVGATAQRFLLPVRDFVTVMALGTAMHLKFGGSTVVAGLQNGQWDLYLPAGASALQPLREGVTHVSVVADTDGALKIMGRD